MCSISKNGDAEIRENLNALALIKDSKFAENRSILRLPLPEGEGRDSPADLA